MSEGTAQIRGYVGIPFVDGGRTIAGCDCWGLVRLVHEREAGIELPDYGEIGAFELAVVARHMRYDADADPWVKVSNLPRRTFDVVVMRRFGDHGRAPIHVGIMVSDRHMLHVENPADSHLVTLEHPTVKPRILEVYRHRRLA
ncbi:MAG: hypothetical protein BGN85_08845 [Alphaproteobacteria bacterium 64-11]|nr:MAG: hypothetical protein BGN85_08845 [Alphaproteobacteria bacterium 64-11]